VTLLDEAAGHQLVKAAHSWEDGVRELERSCLETVSAATC
jgi:hypothetical protein